MDPVSAEPPSYLLAAQASSIVRFLYRRVREGEPDSMADLNRTLGALRRLSDDLAHLLPGLQEQLEESLLDGGIPRTGPTAEAWDTVAGVGLALAGARAAGLLMAQELQASQRLLGGMAAPLDG
ncbi:hypothetical protein BS329_36440 [Amycolatopsis coloradensis]|uniref:Uncharacterized protein n=1 Tax=Amycolatopsis coloradensis TaxID=76021 RepID=A0A1R0KGB6_9PSEU|nr:hypothetical protein [Amycolatopsis coloradensis]OLZ44561.1 hypothetical protein BS329_36440 [Amycolatopsis coloradensis]